MTKEKETNKVQEKPNKPKELMFTQEEVDHIAIGYNLKRMGTFFNAMCCGLLGGVLIGEAICRVWKITNIMKQNLQQPKGEENNEK